jgi:MFS family permease
MTLPTVSAATGSLALGQVPDVPQLVMPATAQSIVTAIVALVAVAALVVAAVLGKRHRTPLYVVVLLGGSLASINEPVADLLGGCMHPQRGGWQVFSIFDRPIPIWVVLAYGLFFGAVPLVVVALTRGRDPRKRFLAAIGVIFAANLLIEVPVIASGMYVYYGEQPFKVGVFPLYWLFINAAGVAGIAVVLMRFGPVFRGARLGWALLLPPASQIAAYLVGMPAFSLYNSSAATPWKWLGAVLTMLLGAAVLQALSRMVPDHASAPVGVVGGSTPAVSVVGVGGS